MPSPSTASTPYQTPNESPAATTEHAVTRTTTATVRPRCSSPTRRRIMTRSTADATTFTVEVASGMPQMPSR